MIHARRPHFFDIFSSDFSDKRLKIPLSFVGSFQGRTSGCVSLFGPSGNTWHVDLIKCGDELCFEQGWPDFVQDNLVENGDLLVFGYCGELNFTVQIFDQTACEKQAAFYSKCNQDPEKKYGSSVEKRAREEGVVASDAIPFGIPKKIRSCSTDGNSESFDETQAAHVRPLSIFYENGQHEETIGGRIRQEADSCERITQNGNTHIDVWNGNPDSAICGSNGKEDSLHDDGGIFLSSEYEEKKVVESFNSRFPFFVRIMKKFNVSGSYTLNVPYQFAMEYLPNSKIEIILRNLKGISWIVNSVPTTRVHTSHTFCGGWLAFVRSNGINVGDVCIFELVHKYELRVHIFHVGKVNPNLSAESLQKKSKKNSKTHSKHRKKFQACDKNGYKMIDGKRCEANKSAIVALCSLSRKANDAAVGSAQRSEAAMGGLRVMLALDEEKAARSFASGYPNFVRIMKKFNVSGSYTLKIPYKFCKDHLPNCRTEIILRNLQGQCWTVNSVPDSRGRMCHTFCGGWMAFIRENDINMGDICIFELVGQWEMRVHISGVGRKGPENQHGSSL